MRETIQLQVSDRGVPVARVPGDMAWDLVEFLSNQRVHVVYSFEESRVVVRFNHIDLRAAADLLDQWVRAETWADPTQSPVPKKEAPLATAWP